jgi:hypothetical protein
VNISTAVARGRGSFGVSVGTVHGDLVDIRCCSLAGQIHEVGLPIKKLGADITGRLAEHFSDSGGRSTGVAVVVVRQHEGDVVPVLGLTSANRRGDLGQEEASRSGDVDVRCAARSTVIRAQAMNDSVVHRVTGATQILRPQLLAIGKLDGGIGWLCVEVSKQLELHRRP